MLTQAHHFISRKKKENAIWEYEKKLSWTKHLQYEGENKSNQTDVTSSSIRSKLSYATTTLPPPRLIGAPFSGERLAATSHQNRPDLHLFQAPTYFPLVGTPCSDGDCALQQLQFFYLGFQKRDTLFVCYAASSVAFTSD